MYHPSNDQRGGFQDRDQRVSRTSGFGPYYGVDYAQYSAKADPLADEELKTRVEILLHDLFHEEVEVSVKNGFVVLKGNVRDDVTRDVLIGAVKDIPYVKQLINDLKVDANPAQ